MATAAANGSNGVTTKQSDSLLDAVVETTRMRNVTEQAADFLMVDKATIYPILKSVWKTSKGQPELTDREVFQGISMIARYELDPIAKEIYVSRGNDGKLMVIVSIDGWVKILDRTDHYDGFEWVLHEGDDGAIDYVDCIIYSTKRSKPTSYRAYAKEYQAIGGFMKGKIPTHMLRLFALRHAARFFTPVGAMVVTEDEARFINDNHDSTDQSVSLESITEELDRDSRELFGDEPDEPQSSTDRPEQPAELSEDDLRELEMEMEDAIKACTSASDIAKFRKTYGPKHPKATEAMASMRLEKISTKEEAKA